MELGVTKPWIGSVLNTAKGLITLLTTRLRPRARLLAGKGHMLSPITLQPMTGPVCQAIATTASGTPRHPDGYVPRGTASKVLTARSGHPKSQQHSSLLGHLSCVATIHTPSVQGYVRCNNKAPALAGARISPSTPLQGNGEGAYPARRRVTLKDTRRLLHNWLWAQLSCTAGEMPLNILIVKILIEHFVILIGTANNLHEGPEPTASFLL